MGVSLSKLLKKILFHAEFCLPWQLKGKTFKIILTKSIGQISKYFSTNDPWVTLYQSCLIYFDWLKNMAVSGHGQFFLSQ